MSLSDPLVMGLGVLALLGVAVAFRGGAKAGHKATMHAREVSRMGGTLTRAVACGAVITGVQWAVLTSTHDPAATAAVLGLPALLAGASIARIFTVTVVSGSGKEARR